MKSIRFPYTFALRLRPILPVFQILLVLMLAAPGPVRSQEEVTTSFRHFRQQEYSTGYYEDYEARPLRQAPIAIPGVRTGAFPYSPSAAEVRVRTRLADSHRGIKFYEFRQCKDCHPRNARNLHTVRANITCRQCHGGEPIAGIQHYFSPMNPIRRHAYICSKCHQGANVSFASYIIHEPFPADMDTLDSFPVLFAAFWFMAAIAAGTFLVFLPHTALWGVREMLTKKKGGAGGS